MTNYIIFYYGIQKLFQTVNKFVDTTVQTLPRKNH